MPSGGYQFRRRAGRGGRRNPGDGAGQAAGRATCSAGRTGRCRSSSRVSGRASGVRPPTARIPDAAARFGARIVDGLYRLGGPERRAPMDPVSVEMAQHFWYCDSTRARTELGWEPRDPMETLEDTVAFLRERFLGGAPQPAKEPSFLETLVTKIADEPDTRAPARKKETPAGRLSNAKDALRKPGSRICCRSQNRRNPRLCSPIGRILPSSCVCGGEPCGMVPGPSNR